MELALRITVIAAMLMAIATPFVWVIRSAIDQWRASRDARDPSKVWSSTKGAFVPRFSRIHVGEAMFQGNQINGTATLGMNGLDEGEPTNDR